MKGLTSFMPALLVGALAFVSGPPSQEPAPQDDGPRAVEGEPAPAIRLNDQSGAAVVIGGKSEHWHVLAFFPKAATPG